MACRGHSRSRADDAGRARSILIFSLTASAEHDGCVRVVPDGLPSWLAYPACVASDPLLTPLRQADPALKPPSLEQQQADALALLAETALHRGMDPGAPGERYQVVVHVDAAVLADAEAPGQVVLEDGVRVSAETSQRLACDASRVVMRHGPDGSVVEVGARTRSEPIWTVPISGVVFARRAA